MHNKCTMVLASSTSQPDFPYSLYKHPPNINLTIHVCPMQHWETW
jgi:hypothetical protein